MRRGWLASGVLLLGHVGCVPQKDPSSHSAESEAANSDQVESLPPALDEKPDSPVAPAAGDRCAALGGFVLSEASSCYMFGDNVFSWQDARNFCQGWGGDLIAIESPGENTALADRIDRSVWIGAHDGEDEGTFRWARGNLIEYAAWGSGQPDDLGGVEDCVELRADNRWNDVACTGEVARRALCEPSAPAD